MPIEEVELQGIRLSTTSAGLPRHILAEKTPSDLLSEMLRELEQIQLQIEQDVEEIDEHLQQLQQRRQDRHQRLAATKFYDQQNPKEKDQEMQL